MQLIPPGLGTSRATPASAPNASPTKKSKEHTNKTTQTPTRMKKTTPTADCIPDSTIVAYGLTPGRVSQAFLDRFEFTEMALPPPPASHQAPISPGRVPQEYLDRLGFAEMILSPPPASQQGYSSTPDVVSLSDVEDEWCNQELSEALAQSEREMMIEHKRREDEDGEKEASRREVMEGIRLSQEEKDVRRSRREDLRRLEVRREMDFRAVDGFSVQDEVAQAMAASAVTYAAEQRRQTQRRRRQHQVQGQLLQTLAPRPSAAADVNTPPPLLDYFSPAEARKQLRAEFVPPSQSQHVPPWEPRKGKFYAVWVGRTLGVFTNWNGVEQSTKSFPGARQRSFAQHGWAKGAYEHAVVGNGLRDLGQWDGEGVWVVLKGLRPGVCVGKVNAAAALGFEGEMVLEGAGSLGEASAMFNEATNTGRVCSTAPPVYSPVASPSSQPNR